jgi:chemotaxis signal transduction protein
VARTLEDAYRSVRRGSVAVLPVGVGGLELGIPLENVHYVLHQLPTRPLPFGPPYLRETFDFGGDPVCVLDLAEALGVRHSEPILNRKLIVVIHEHLTLALCVDSVRDPEEFPPHDVVTRQRLGGTDHGALPRVLSAIVRSAHGMLPVVDAVAFLSPGMLDVLSQALSSPGADAVAPEVP